MIKKEKFEIGFDESNELIDTNDYKESIDKEEEVDFDSDKYIHWVSKKGDSEE